MKIENILQFADLWQYSQNVELFKKSHQKSSFSLDVISSHKNMNEIANFLMIRGNPLEISDGCSNTNNILKSMSILSKSCPCPQFLTFVSQKNCNLSFCRD